MRYQNRCAHNIYCDDVQSSRNNPPANASGAFPLLFQCPLNINDGFCRKPSKHKGQGISRGNGLPPRCPNATRHLSAFTIARQKNSILILLSYVYIIHFNIILPTAPVFEEAYFLRVFTPKFCIHFSARPHTQMPHLSHSTCC